MEEQSEEQEGEQSRQQDQDEGWAIRHWNEHSNEENQCLQRLFEINAFDIDNFTNVTEKNSVANNLHQQLKNLNKFKHDTIEKIIQILFYKLQNILQCRTKEVNADIAFQPINAASDLEINQRKLQMKCGDIVFIYENIQVFKAKNPILFFMLTKLIYNDLAVLRQSTDNVNKWMLNVAKLRYCLYKMSFEKLMEFRFEIFNGKDKYLTTPTIGTKFLPAGEEMEYKWQNPRVFKMTQKTLDKNIFPIQERQQQNQVGLEPQGPQNKKWKVVQRREPKCKLFKLCGYNTENVVVGNKTSIYQEIGKNRTQCYRKKILALFPPLPPPPHLTKISISPELLSPLNNNR